MPKIKITNEMRPFIQDHYKGISRVELLKLVNEKFGTQVTSKELNNYMNYRKMHCEYDTRFKKGNKQTRKYSVEDLEKLKKYYFQKGHKPHNTLPIGTETITKQGYILVRVDYITSESCKHVSRQVFKHKLVWEQHYGKIPKGYQILFLDGNRQNCDIENLMLVTSGEMVTLHNSGVLRSKDKELILTQLNVYRLKRKIKEIEYEQKQKCIRDSQ